MNLLFILNKQSASNLAQGIINARKEAKYGLLEKDRTICVLKTNELTILNLICRHYFDIFCNRTFTYVCFIQQDYRKTFSNLKYFQTSFEYEFQYGKETLNIPFEISFAFLRDINIFEQDLSFLKIRPNESWEIYLKTLQSPKEWWEILDDNK